jgi:hypothetical protein
MSVDLYPSICRLHLLLLLLLLLLLWPVAGLVARA